MSSITPSHAEDFGSDPRLSPREILDRQPRWALILRGISGILFGLVAFLMPGLTFIMLIGLFAAYMLIDGIFALASGVRAGRRGERWWPFILEGVANLAVAAAALLLPAVTGLVIVYLFAAWSIFTGVMLLIPNPANGTRSRVLLVLAGIVSILLGIAMIVQPIAGSLAIVWMVGTYGFVFGGLLLAAGLRNRSPAAADSVT